MANTYTQLYFHIVIVVKGRKNYISSKWQIELYKYITGVITNKGQKLYILNGVEDHVHILISTKPNCNLSDLVRDIKANSSRWINEKNLIQSKFEWQKGFGAFTICQSRLPQIIKYIERQEEHHSKKTFNEEYKEFLVEYEVDFKDEYLFNAE